MEPKPGTPLRPVPPAICSARQVFSAVLLSGPELLPRGSVPEELCCPFSVSGAYLIAFKTLLQLRGVYSYGTGFVFFYPKWGIGFIWVFLFPRIRAQRRTCLSNVLAVGLLRIGSSLYSAVTCLVDEGHRHIPAPIDALGLGDSRCRQQLWGSVARVTVVTEQAEAVTCRQLHRRDCNTVIFLKEMHSLLGEWVTGSPSNPPLFSVFLHD